MKILTPQVNENDVIALVHFAQQYNVLGFELNDLTLSSPPEVIFTYLIKILMYKVTYNYNNLFFLILFFFTIIF